MNTPIISFYSYKGGSGRTTTAVNTIPYLANHYKASKSRPILVIDFDVESAGLTYFYKYEKRFYGECGQVKFNSIHSQQFFSDKEFIAYEDNVNRLFDTGNYKFIYDTLDESTYAILYDFIQDNMDSSVDISFIKNIPLKYETKDVLNNLIIASKQEASIMQSHNKFKLKDFILELLTYKGKNYTEKEISERIEGCLPTNELVDISSIYGFEKGTIKFLGVDDANSASLNTNTAEFVLEQLMEICSRFNYSCIVLDTSSGRQSSAHVAHRCSKVLVYCMRPSNQFRVGTTNNLMFYENDILEGEKKSQVIILPTAVPQNKDIYRSGEKTSIPEQVFDEINRMIVNKRDYIDGRFCNYRNSLCEVEIFKWTEEILYNREKLQPLKHDEKRASDVYKELANAIIQDCL